METFNIDFSGVESSGGQYYVEPGTYNVKIIKVEKGQKEGGDYPYLKWYFNLLGNDSLELNLITSLSPKALFKLKELLEAVGLEVPDGTIKIDPTQFIGKICSAEIADREYNGKVYSNLVKVFKPQGTTSSSASSIDDIL
jgi:hypothetical protein